ncbi:MarR family transcriptional regulator [Streptomyces sp. MP131-18]|uniref:MarR family winged helix-turn-helix transcriptional regulator n=1 Tax=Streptomyces sp. MP131-18 TaxID=1857892 RepID=UPI00097C9652|nr:MarR family transcriptional regulator [Streptomyces sp. MP131-18]ONK13512.1 Multidrug resistance operon repressor [Streptomyces sp. MP131-18]
MTTRPAAAELIHSSTAYMVLRLGDAARDRIDQVLSRFGITGRDMRVMSFAQGRALSQRDLSRLASLDRTTMVAVVDKLEGLGLVRRERSAADRRKQVVTLTGRGTGLLDELTFLLAGEEAGFLAPLTGEEQRLLNGLMTKLYEAHDPSCAAP